MKNRTKRKQYVICLVVCSVLFLIVGCSNNSPNQIKPDISELPENLVDTGVLDNEDNEPNDVEKPEIEIVDVAKDITIYCERTYLNNLDEIEIVEWETYIYDKYDNVIDLIIGNTISILEIDISEIDEKTNLDGFIYIYSFWQLEKLIDAGVLTPVNKYLKNISEYSVIDSRILNSYIEYDNNIWAFPLGGANDSIPLSTRVYNKEWLEKANVNVPETLNEFYEYANYIVNEDPDDNGLRDTYIDAIDVNDITKIIESLSDIWKAFGCYFDFGQVAYNPETKMIEDFILNEQFVKAAIYIKNLIDEGLIFLGEEDEFGNNTTHKIASSGIRQIEKTKQFKGWAIGHFLIGDNDSFLIKYMPPSTSLAVLKNTKNIEEKMEMLISDVKRYSESYMDFWAGIEGVHYKKSGDSYEILVPENIDDLKLVFMDLNFNGSFPDELIKFENYEEEDFHQEIKKLVRIELEEFHDLDFIYSVPYNTYSYSLIELNNALYGPLIDLLTAIFIENEDITGSIEQYVLTTEKGNKGNSIDLLNAN